MGISGCSGFCATPDWKKAKVTWKMLRSPWNRLFAFLLSWADIYSTQTNKLLPRWIIELLYSTSGWGARSTLLQFLAETSREILPQQSWWLRVKYIWAIIRADKLWNIWVREVTLVRSHFLSEVFRALHWSLHGELWWEVYLPLIFQHWEVFSKCQLDLSKGKHILIFFLLKEPRETKWEKNKNKHLGELELQWAPVFPAATGTEVQQLRVPVFRGLTAPWIHWNKNKYCRKEVRAAVEQKDEGSENLGTIEWFV